ncbi:hypothetical protein PVAP13_1KG500600 [Panicum virgatum]|uniref:Uncharacterized protein n=1 Tax=Panicum virgatum TaxID=38727 RepID=A0A8T0XP23_PANVG|nr:hypothetical protein PVAP13_1KG500600 [Panicum virgatum]
MRERDRRVFAVRATGDGEKFFFLSFFRLVAEMAEICVLRWRSCELVVRNVRSQQQCAQTQTLERAGSIRSGAPERNRRRRRWVRRNGTGAC